ncbi:PREDICTED: endo-1,3;1,4-beta-D-glucanase-like [Ipomoea nil]|uniref:endo-1,3;1,4-beta-D-glucanase-like n=1 Tax=Ipomoea nil TaxID=35883 RepID=UPI000900D17A|nr:PREDICTED: endo-1,3;1,4-beta-D-glucanase-like [Ipomoea nil]
MSGPQCFNNPPTLSSTTGSGSLQEIAGIKTYVSGSQDSKLAILMISDAFGYEAPNLRKLADKVAGAGFLVVVPDLFYGDPFDHQKYATAVQSWLAAHPPSRGCDDARTLVETLKNMGVSSVGATGFCWGGMVVAKLAKSDCIGAAVILHPGKISVEEIEEVKVPTAILGAEFDHICPVELIKQLGDALSAKPEIDSFVKVFPGVKHGWTLRYDDKDEEAIKVAEEAHSDMLNWLTNYIK